MFITFNLAYNIILKIEEYLNFTLPKYHMEEKTMVHLRSKKFEGKKSKERIYYYLVKDEYSTGKKIQKVVKYLGTANKIYEKILRLEELEDKN
jgi:hypothetical protein